MLKWSWLIDVFLKRKCSICGDMYFKAHATCPSCTREMFAMLRQEAWQSDDEHGDIWQVLSNPETNPNPHPYYFGITEENRPVISPNENDWQYIYGED